MTTRFTTERSRTTEQVELDLRSRVVLAFSWLLVLALGLLPLAEATMARSPSIATPALISFFVAVASGIVLRRRYSWVGLAMHIYGQIAIWLSLFVMSLAALLFVAGA
ncbi:hypothetical protein [Sphingomonas sp. VNH70]|jgi:hypothetical protein|uniref:hypothetical protein n=1 Tax=Sphingomonas silueang TaxID=3156617 RepID=UPI0028ECDFB7|nr:hypothetical protein [uncultured Sphingomonas sp.]